MSSATQLLDDLHQRAKSLILSFSEQLPENDRSIIQLSREVRTLRENTFLTDEQEEKVQEIFAALKEAQDYFSLERGGEPQRQYGEMVVTPSYGKQQTQEDDGWETVQLSQSNLLEQNANGTVDGKEPEQGANSIQSSPRRSASSPEEATSQIEAPEENRPNKLGKTAQSNSLYRCCRRVYEFVLNFLVKIKQILTYIFCCRCFRKRVEITPPTKKPEEPPQSNSQLENEKKSDASQASQTPASQPKAEDVQEQSRVHLNWKLELAGSPHLHLIETTYVAHQISQHLIGKQNSTNEEIVQKFIDQVGEEVKQLREQVPELGQIVEAKSPLPEDHPYSPIVNKWEAASKHFNRILIDLIPSSLNEILANYFAESNQETFPSTTFNFLRGNQSCLGFIEKISPQDTRYYLFNLSPEESSYIEIFSSLDPFITRLCSELEKGKGPLQMSRLLT